MADDPYLKFINPEHSVYLLNGDPHFNDWYIRNEAFDRPNAAKKPATQAGKSSGNYVMRRLRRARTVFTSEQVDGLKYYFMQCNYVNIERAQEIANELSLGTGNVRIWFKNQRRKVKLKEIEKQKETTPEPYKLTPYGVYIPSLTTPPTPTPSPSVSEVDVSFTINPNYINSTAYQWLQHLPPMTSTDTIYNSPNENQHHMQLPQLHQPPQDSVVHFNRLPHTIPSPSMSNGGGHPRTPNSNNSDTSDYFSQMSPDSEIIDPATPASESESAFNDILDTLTIPKTEPQSSDDIYEKFISTPEQNFDSKDNQIYQPYNVYQSAAPNSEQGHCLEL